MEEELQRLSTKVQEALEEVQHVRDRVKKMCHELGQVDISEKAPTSQADEAYTTKLKTLLSSVSQEAPTGPATTPQEADRKDIGRKLIAERDEVLSLEKELAALQLSLKEADPPGHLKEASPEDLQSALPRALSTGPEGPVDRAVLPERAPEGQTDADSGELEKKDACADIAPKAKAMAACPGRTSRSSLPKPPPPKAKPAPKAKVRAQAPDEEAEDGTSSRLVNLHWRASQAPPEETEIFVGKDGYLQCMSTMMERWGIDRADRMRQSIQSFEDRAGAVEAERHDAERDVERDPKQTPSRRRRKTVFNAADVVPIPELPQNRLEDLFAARAATFDIGARSSSTSDVSSLIVDSTHQRILDLMVRSEAMQRQRESGNIRNDAVEHAVTELLATLQSCDFSRLTRSVLNDLRKVVVHHLEGGHNILSFVESRGVEALSRLEHPHLHQLLYGVLRIPGISTRLECMDLVAKFPAEMESCREDLQILRRALLQIRDRQAAFRAFWTMAMHLGNTLNGSAAGGFRLSSLSKLLDLKSPDRKEMTLFHFVLLQLPCATVEALTDPELLNALKMASSKRTHTVHQDVLVHLDGFRRLEGFVATGSFKGERIPRMDGSDPFHQAMADFVRESQSACAELWASSMQVFQSYRDMGIFFQDLSYVYPPPGGAEEDRRKDLFGVLGNFVAECAKAQQEIDGSKDGPMGLGVQVLDSGFTPPYLSTSKAPPAPATPRRPEPLEPPEPPEPLEPLEPGTPETTALVSKFNVSPLSPLDPIMASPSREGPLLTPTPTALLGPPPARSLKAYSPSMPSVPPPKRGPGTHHWPNLPGTPTLLTSPTSPEYCRATRKSLAACAAKVAAQTLGSSAARVRGESETSSVEFISSSHSSFDYSSRSSSESSSSFGHSDSSQRDQKQNQNDPHHDLQTQLKQELRRRRHSGSLGSTHSARSTPRSSGSGPWEADSAGGSMSGPSQVTEAMLASFMAVPRKSRTPPLSPVKERGETPYRIACQ